MGSSGSGQPMIACYQHHHKLAEISAHQVEQRLGDVVVYAAALLDCRDDGCEIVVDDYDVGGLLGDLGPGDPHGDADCGLFERRSVIDAVTRHRNHHAVATSRRGRSSACAAAVTRE